MSFWSNSQDDTKIDKDTELLKKANVTPTWNEKLQRLEFCPSPHLKNDDIPKSFVKDKYNRFTKLNKESITTMMTKNKFEIKSVETIFKCDNNQTNKYISTYAPHQFLDAATKAWSSHYPIILSPTHFWLLILQGVAIHVNNNSEKLRKQWVNFKGKKGLEIRRDEFILGSDKNDWGGAIEEFNEQIKDNVIDDTYEIIDPKKFSNITLNEKICIGVTIMDLCQKYFAYKCSTCCGFPKVILEGKKEDWIMLQEKTNKLLRRKVEKQFGLNWLKVLNPILNRFTNCYNKNHKIDCIFWNSMIKEGHIGGSGGYSYISGWINAFIPFEDDKKTLNKFCFGDDKLIYDENNKNIPYYAKKSIKYSGGRRDKTGLKTSYIPCGLGSAPVEWEYYGNRLYLQFISGFMGFEQNKNDDYAIKPICGWSIIHTNDTKIKQQIDGDSKLFNKN